MDFHWGNKKAKRAAGLLCKSRLLLYYISMQLQNIIQKDYTTNQVYYQLKLPLNIDCMIPEDDSVRLLSQFIEGMDLNDFMQRIPE